LQEILWIHKYSILNCSQINNTLEGNLIFVGDEGMVFFELFEDIAGDVEIDLLCGGIDLDLAGCDMIGESLDVLIF